MYLLSKQNRQALCSCVKYDFKAIYKDKYDPKKTLTFKKNSRPQNNNFSVWSRLRDLGLPEPPKNVAAPQHWFKFITHMVTNSTSIANTRYHCNTWSRIRLKTERLRNPNVHSTWSGLPCRMPAGAGFYLLESKLFKTTGSGKFLIVLPNKVKNIQNRSSKRKIFKSARHNPEPRIFFSRGNRLRNTLHLFRS